MERRGGLRGRRHALSSRLLAEGKVDGLRIDHPDGLYDPKQYLHRLQEHYLLARADAGDAAGRSRARRWEDARGAAHGRASMRQARDRGPGRSTSSLEKILGATRRCRRTGRSTAPPATTSSTSLNGLFVDADKRRGVRRASTTSGPGRRRRFAEVVYRRRSC